MVLWLAILGVCLGAFGAFMGLIALARWWEPAAYGLIVVVAAAGLTWLLVHDDDDRADML